MTLLLPAVRALQARGATVTWLIQADAHRLVGHIQDIDWQVMTGGMMGGRRLRSAIPPKSRVLLLETPTVETGVAVCSRRVEDHSGPIDEKRHALEDYWERVHGAPPGPQDRAHWRLTDAVPDPGNTLLLNLCTSSPAKDWTVEGWVAVIRCAQEELGRTVIAVHSETGPDKRILEQIRQKVRVLDLVCTLAELLELLAGACCLVSPDTGPAHLAGVVGTPVVGIYGYTKPEQWGPYWSQEWTVYRKPSTKDVDPAQVLERLRSLARAGYPRAGGEGATFRFLST